MSDTAHFDAIRGDYRALAEIKFSVDALRTVRTALIRIVYALDEYPEASAYLVLVEPSITEARLREEWEKCKSVFKPELLDRIWLCVVTSDGVIRGVPNDPAADIADWIREVVDRQARRLPTRSERTDYEFVVLKLLMLQWLTKREPVTTLWLSETAGCSYPTVARVLKRLGTLVDRKSDRRVVLRYFPMKEFEWLIANAERARSTTRFVDASGQPRDPLSHLSRLEKLKPSGVAVGGVVGARHSASSLDIVGTPRLDLSVHCHNTRFDIDFVKQLDPALKLQEDPRGPANVVVHAVRHKDPLFIPRDGLLPVADPLECLLDLHEAHLQTQATQFLSQIQSVRKVSE
mgnify:CR=1 FL=1